MNQNMSLTCLNCGTEISDQFCPHCGQKKEVKRLTWHSLVHEVAHFLSHIEEGFIKTSVQLVYRPGRTIREYLEGKRKTYYKPVALYLVWATIFLITHNLVTRWMHYEAKTVGNFLFFNHETGNYFVQHRNIFELLLLPIMALFAWLIITRPKMNYIETLALGIYMFSVLQMFNSLQIIINGLLLRINFMTNMFEIQVLVVNLGWGFFCLMDFYKKEKKPFLPFRILATFFITIIVYYKLGAIIVNLILGFEN